MKEEKKKYIVVNGGEKLMNVNRAIKGIEYWVNKAIEDGYVCQGGAFVADGYIMQTMVLNQEDFNNGRLQ